MVKFKIGKETYELSKGTLLKCQDSIFPNLLEQESYTIDRNEEYFPFILEYVRNGKEILKSNYLHDKDLKFLNALKFETQYYQTRFFELFLSSKINEYEELEGTQYKNEGNELMKKGKYKDAIVCYNKAISFSNDNAIYFVNRGFAYEKFENHENAIKDYTKGIELNPNYSKGHSRLGNLYFRKNDYLNAKKHYKLALNIEPENEKYQKDYDECLHKINSQKKK